MLIINDSSLPTNERNRKELTPENFKEVISLDEMAEYLELSVETLRTHIKRRGAPYYIKKGKQWVLQAEYLEWYLEMCQGKVV